MAADTTQRALDAYFAAIKALDADAFVACFAADAVQEDPVGAPANHGHEAIRTFFDGITAAFDQLELAPDATFISGASAAVKWTGRGTGKNGRPATFEGIDIVDLNDAGTIQRLRAFWDPRAMMRQLRG